MNSIFFRINSVITIISFLFFISCGDNSESKKNSSNIQSNELKQDTADINSWSDLQKYVGTYPLDTDFLKNPIIENELKNILGNDYEPYNNFIKHSGCGEVLTKNNLIYCDISQLHVGGYSSIIFIDTKNRKMYLFWMNDVVEEKKYKIYGAEPVPSDVLTLIVDSMNETWGHVAQFKTESGNVFIDLIE